MIDYCLEKARELPYTHGKYRIYSVVLDRKGKILGESANLYEKSHPKQKHYSKKAGMNDHRIYLHAELAAMLRVRNGTPTKIVIARVDRNGNPVNACPCPSCQIAIKEFGISSIEFTT